MKPPVREINLNARAPKVHVDNQIPIHIYYRIADNLLKQASIYREENNLIDLYVILLRFSSLLCETIPYHRDYLTFPPKRRATFKRKLSNVISELETLKPNVQCQVDDMNQQYIAQLAIGERAFYSSTDSVSLPSTKKQNLPNLKEQTGSTLTSSSSSWRYNENNQIRSLDQSKVDKQFLKPFLTLPQPKEETLSRHSFLGPSGFQGRKAVTVTGTRVQYPSNTDLSKIEMPILSQARVDLKSDNGNSREPISEMDSVLSLDDGRWSQPCVDTISENCLQLDIKQPSPPPVLARVQPQQGFASIPSSQVADPRPGPAKTYDIELPDTETYKHLHIPVEMMKLFLRLAESNTAKNLETCGVLAGSLKNKNFCVTTLIIPKQEATSDSCQTTDEEEIFDFQDKRSLFPLGWIHTHPTQTCFMSSVDLHTHYSYQIMLPEAIAIVMAPTDESRTHGIFHLSDPGGVSVIRNCQERGFHPHEEPSDGSSLYEHCSHVYMNPNLQIEVADLR